ncbi:hypothetical protein B0H19DRAFT_1070268 [Mycena capillaripes]|nr:hypothetical protein B0H19DRAFT_1070268 [Mycena capillaripes]
MCGIFAGGREVELVCTYQDDNQRTCGGVANDEEIKETPPANQRGVGGNGGLGAGPQVLTLPIGDTLGRKIEIPRMGLAEFCTEYKLGKDIRDILDEAELEVRGLIGVDNLGKKEFGLKFGQVAEIKWALKALLLKCPAIEEVPIPRGFYQPKIMGTPYAFNRFPDENLIFSPRRDRGGGGAAEKQGGAGGEGEGGVGGIGGANFFLGGVGGAGGADGLPFGNNSAYGKNPNGEEGSSSPYAENDGGISGGKGGRGGWGYWLGGEGGVGGAPIIPLEAIGEFQYIQGGRGGDGGAAVEVGGLGGKGEAPKFPAPLAVIDHATRLQVQAMNMKLKDGEKVNEKLREFKFDIGQKLLDRLHEHGFQSVGALFEIQDIDLDVAPFKPGNKYTLKDALMQFLQEVNKNPILSVPTRFKHLFFFLVRVQLIDHGSERIRIRIQGVNYLYAGVHHKKDSAAIEERGKSSIIELRCLEQNRISILVMCACLKRRNSKSVPALGLDVQMYNTRAARRSTNPHPGPGSKHEAEGNASLPFAHMHTQIVKAILILYIPSI